MYVLVYREHKRISVLGENVSDDCRVLRGYNGIYALKTATHSTSEGRDNKCDQFLTG